MRKTIIVLACGIGLLLLGYTSYRGYQVWKQDHGMAMARGYYAKGDMRNTLLGLEQVLNINPRNLEACRMMADLTEKARNPGGLNWRQRVLELNPRSFKDRLALAQAAIIFQQYALATNTLAGVDEADKQTADYQNIAGTAALVCGQLDEAETHYSEAIRLNPGNPAPQVNLAVVRLRRTNTLDMADARIALQRVIMTSTNAVLCNQARRELVNDAMRFNDMPTALARSKELADQANSVLADKLLRLDVLMKIKSPEFKPALALCQREAATNPAEIFEMANWQLSKFSPAETLGWLQGLPPQTRTNQPAALLAAQCQVQLNDWHGLQVAIDQQNWHELEFIRHALMARSLREQGLAEASTAEWGVALKFASDQKNSLLSLFHLAADWNWHTEAEQILWTVVNRYPEEKEAATSLEQALISWHRTSSLMQLYELMLKRSPDDAEIKNNLAMTCMLVGSQEYNPYSLAHAVYQQDSKNVSYASTYAFSLYLQGKYPEALKVMQQLAPKDLENPSVAGYYGVVLKANGQKAEARAYLKRSSQAQLLPEEQALFDQARAGL